MDPWSIWLIIAVVLAGAEVISGDFFLLMIGGGALAASGVALVGGPTWLQFVVFGIVAVLLVLLVRPWARGALTRSTPQVEDGARSHIGSTGTVTQTVDAHGGRILVGGDEWSALTQSPFEQLEVGTAVRIVEIRGAHAVVAEEIDL